MLSIIASILSSTLGLLLNRVRTKAAGRLKDGDVVDEKLRDNIIEDLNDVKTKIDGLSRKDLLSSYCFLKEGVGLLNFALDESNDEPKYKESVALVGGGETTTTTTAHTQGKTTSGVLNEALALSNAIQKLNNTSSGRLVSAKERFKAAREEATRAFCNEALTIQDRIMAAKLRVVSIILESLQDTKAAATSCTLFLEELHNLPAIGEIFSTYFKGAIKSWFYKASRLENVKSVLSLNFAASEFIARFSGEFLNVRKWPKIHLSNRAEAINPLLLDPDLVKKIYDKGEIQLPQNHFLLHITPRLLHWGINSKGELIASTRFRVQYLYNVSRLGRMDNFCQLRNARANIEQSPQDTEALAIDRHDNVYVILSFHNARTSYKSIYVLFVFDSNGCKQSDSELNFLTEQSMVIKCVVTNDRDVIIHFCWTDHYYVCDTNGILKTCVSLEHSSSYCPGDFISLQCVTDQNEILMRTSKDKSNHHVLVYTIEGKLKREIKVENEVVGVTYDYVTSKIKIFAGSRFDGEIRDCRMLDDVECLYLGTAFTTERYTTFISHPVGLMALSYYAKYGGESRGRKVIFM